MTWKSIVRAGQATDDMVHVHGVLNTKGYKHTLRICNTELLFCCSNGCMNCRSVTLHVHCLCCNFLLPALETMSTAHTVFTAGRRNE